MSVRPATPKSPIRWRGRERKRFSRYLWHCGAASNERRVCADGRTDGRTRTKATGADWDWERQAGRQAGGAQTTRRRSQNVIAPFWTGMKSAREDCDCSGGMGRDGWVVGWPVSGHAFFLVTPHKLSFTVNSLPPRNCAPRGGSNRDYYSVICNQICFFLSLCV